MKKCTCCKKIKTSEEFSTWVYDKAANKSILTMKREDDLRHWCRLCEKKYRLVNSAAQRARKKNLPFKLTTNDITIPNYCPVLGIEIVMDNDKTAENSPSLDRIDNTKGYTKDNVIVISHKANAVKNCANVEELGKIYNFYKNLEESKNSS